MVIRIALFQENRAITFRLARLGNVLVLGTTLPIDAVYLFGSQAIELKTRVPERDTPFFHVSAGLAHVEQLPRIYQTMDQLEAEKKYK